MARDPDKGEWRMPRFAFRTNEVLTEMVDVFRRPGKVLEEIGVSEGYSVVDYGSGHGNFTIPAAELVGKKGMVHAVDAHPLSIEIIEEKAERRGLKNIETIFSDIDTGLDDESVDVVLLYGVLYKTDDKNALLKEVRRILKTGGLISIANHRMNKDILIKMMRRRGFRLRNLKRGILNFEKSGKF